MPPSPPPTTLPLDASHPLLASFASFLTISIHNILFYRSIYPPSTFLSTRAYNLPVHQNRHPKVCSWILDAVSSVTTQLLNGHVSRIAVVIHAPLTPSPSPSSRLPPGAVLERWVFDVSQFPTWPSKKNAKGEEMSGANAFRDYGRMLEKEAQIEEAREQHESAAEEVNWTDVNEAFRGVLRRMASTAERMEGLPEGSTFTVAVELKEEGLAPIGHPQAWIPSEPKLQTASQSRAMAGEDVGGAKTMPVRTVEAGPLFFECWVEEGKAKEAYLSQSPLPGTSTQESGS